MVTNNNSYSTTTKQNHKIEQVNMSLAVRLIIFGGAVKASDNSAFKFASKNVIADYKNDLPIKDYLIINGANTVVSVLETQKENTVQSLDLFCHGDPNGIYFVIGSSLEKMSRIKNENL